ncbi:MAG: hypothetical protein Kow0090_15650 [Myxococcota bacterium]
MRLHIENEFDISADRLVELLLDDGFERGLWDSIGFSDVEILELKKEEGRRYRKAKVTPQTELPGFLKKVVGGASGYYEITDWDIKKRVNKWKTYLSEKMPGVNIAGDFFVEDLGGGRCKRVVDGEVDVKLPLIGKKIEEFLIKETEKSYEKINAYIKHWIVEKEKR